MFLGTIVSAWVVRVDGRGGRTREVLTCHKSTWDRPRLGTDHFINIHGQSTTTKSTITHESQNTAMRFLLVINK